MTGGFSEAELRELLAREEGQFLEFKSLWDLEAGDRRVLDRKKVRDAIAEQIAAFANADGGILVLGVDDDGTPSGHGYPEEAIVDFLAVPERRLRPAVRIKVQRPTLDGKELLILEVGITAEAVMFKGNGFPYRVGDSVIHEPQEVINERKQAYRRVGYEQRIRPEATVADLDLDLARSFLSRTVHRERSVEELLDRYGLVVARGSSPVVTNAALLLFGKAPLVRWHPRAGIRFFRVAGTERKHGTQRNVTQLERLDLPIAALIPEAHRYAATQIRRSEKLHDLFFREIPEYPEFAWQEAIINAVAHRDYADQGREIEIWFYTDRMEVLSPGDLVAPVKLEDLRGRRRVHASRNPLLVRVLVESGHMREEGEGIPRIFEEMEQSFLKPPGLEVEATTFRLTLRNEPVFEGPTPEWQAIVSRLDLSPSQRRILLARPEGFTNEEYRNLNSVDRDQAYREIQEMVSLGVVTSASSTGRGAFYRLSPDLAEARAWLNARLPGLREHFDRELSLQNADYRRLFGVTRLKAVRDLRRLVEEGFLRVEGQRRSTRYLPGPQLERRES